MGLGAQADGGDEVDKEHKSLKMAVKAGLAIGVGGGVAGEATFGGDGVGDFASGETNKAE